MSEMAAELRTQADYIEGVAETCPNRTLQPGAEWAVAVLRVRASELEREGA